VFALLVLLGVMGTPAQVDLSSAALFPSVVASIPENIEAPPAILKIMREMWAVSPAFRYQCARIAQARHGRVVVEIRKPSAEFQAVSNIERSGLAWQARVQVFIDANLVEMIAHEFEHVIEQIDAIDLARLAKQGLDGVIPGHTHFETVRAVAAGKRIAKEFRQHGA
jgi:hypothetical protein